MGQSSAISRTSQRLTPPTAGGGRAPAGGTPPTARLESKGNKVTNEGQRVHLRTVVCDHKCNVRTCPCCGKKMGWAVRQRMLQKAAFWRSPAVLTLTMDRKRRSSPVEAHRAVTEGKFIWRLMRALRIKRWLWVLEYQQRTGDGWPHWHLLIDLADVPGGALNLRKAWDLWRDKWGMGGLDLEVRKDDFESAQHAVFYITKYLTKQPEGGYPVWVLKSQRAIRFVQGCRALGPLVSESREREEEPEPEEEDEPKKKPRKPLLDRMSACRITSKAFAVSADAETGEEHWRYVGRIRRTAFALAEDGVVQEERDQFGRTTYYTRLPPSVFFENVRGCGNPGSDERVARMQALHRKSILAENKFRKRMLDRGEAVD